jgi:hypothetical protein
VSLKQALDNQICILAQNHEKIIYWACSVHERNVKSINLNGRDLCMAGSVIVECILKKLDRKKFYSFNLVPISGL